MKKLVFSFLALAASTAHAQWDGTGLYGTGVKPATKYVPSMGRTIVEAENNCTQSGSTTYGLGAGRVVGYPITVTDKKGYIAVACLRQDEHGTDIAVAGVDMTETTAKDSCRKDSADFPYLKKGLDQGLTLPVFANGSVSIVVCKRPTTSAPTKRTQLNAQETAQVKEQVGLQLGSRYIKFEVQRNLTDDWLGGSTLTGLDIAIENSSGERSGCLFHNKQGNAYSKVIGLRKVLCADAKEFGYEGGSDNDMCLQVVTAKSKSVAMDYYSTDDQSLRNPRNAGTLESADVFSSTYLINMFSAPGACLP